MRQFLRTTCLVAIILGLLGLRANAQPTIFNWSRSANPGDVVSLQGDSFGNSPEVWIECVTGSSAPAPTTQLPVLSGTGFLSPTGANSCVTALIPATEPFGLYALWVSADGGSTFSQPVYINQAMPWNADDLCGSQVDPNRQFHLYGRNLQFSGTGTPTVSFVSTSSTLGATVTSGTDPYVLSVTAPSGVLGGATYTLMVNNGFGGYYGTVAGPVLSGTITSGSDPFGLGVPWGADFAAYSNRVYTVPFVSSTTNMQSAIQTAINAVSGSGGGIVALQSGTYAVLSGSETTCLYLESNVVIEGAGLNQTVIEMSGTSTSNLLGYHFGLWDADNTLIDCGLANLTLYSTDTVGQSNLGINHPNHDKFFALNAEFKSDAPNDVVVSGSQILLKNCVFFSGSGVLVNSGTTVIREAGSPVNYSTVFNSVIENNLFQYYNGRLWLSNGCTGLLVLSNTMSRIAFSGTIGETGALDVQQSQDTVALGNVFQRDPTFSGTYNLVENNDGETIMNQTGHDAYPCQGGVSSSSSNTLTDTTRGWAANEFVNAPDGQDYYVTIIQGTGAGQIHKVIANTGTTLTVDSPWQVLPASDSMYSVHHLESLRHLIKDNTLTNVVQGIVYYSISTKDTAIVNNTMNNGGGIYFRCDYRPSTTGSSQFDVQFDTLIAGNSVTVTSADPYNWTDSHAYITDFLENTGTAIYPGTQAFCTEFRGNTLTAPVPNAESGIVGEGFGIEPTTNSAQLPSPDGTTALSVGAVFQGNTAVSCSNGFHLCTGDYCTTLWSNTLDNCGAAVWDGTGYQTGHASIATVYGPVTPAITSQPQSATVIEGGTAAFTVTASGLTAPGCQWQRMAVGSGTWSNMTNISGTYVGTATGTFTVTNATLAMNGDQFQCIASNGYPPNATSSAAILTVETGYSAWASSLFGSQFSNNSISGPVATPQNDGVPNAVKYLCGINPSTPISASGYAALPVAGTTTASGTSYLTLTYRQNPSTPGLALSVQTCTDMKSWATVTPYSTQTIGTDPATGDPIIQIKVQSGGGKLFARLQVTVS